MTIKEKLRSIGRQRGVSYALSIRERAVRSASALTGKLVEKL